MKEKDFALETHQTRVAANLIRRGLVPEKQAVDFLAEREYRKYCKEDGDSGSLELFKKIVSKEINGGIAASCAIGLFGDSETVVAQYRATTQALADAFGLGFSCITISEFVLLTEAEWLQRIANSKILLVTADMMNEKERTMIEKIVDGHPRMNAVNTLFITRAKRFPGLISLVVLNCDLDELSSRYTLSLRLLSGAEWPLIHPALPQEAWERDDVLSPTEKNMIVTFSCAQSLPSVGYNSWDRMRLLEAA